MQSKPGAYYWDACVFLDGFRKTPGRIDDIATIERHGILEGLFVYTATYSLAEVNRINKEYDRVTTDEVRKVERYFGNKWIKIVPVDKLTARIAAEIVRQGFVKPPDAIHLASAAKVGCIEFHTYDGFGGKRDGLLTVRNKISPVTVGGKTYTIPKIVTPAGCRLVKNDKGPEENTRPEA